MAAWVILFTSENNAEHGAEQIEETSNYRTRIYESAVAIYDCDEATARSFASTLFGTEGEIEFDEEA